MHLITLTTDWGIRDHYTGALKGALLSAVSDVQIIDISHIVQPNNILHAAYILKNVWKHFPDGTIHLIGIDANNVKERRMIVMKHENHFFAGMDNGFFSLLFKQKPDSIFQIGNADEKISQLLVKAAVAICTNNDLQTLGTPIDSYIEKTQISPVLDSSVIISSVIYKDDYGNLVLNLDQETFENIRKERRFEIHVRTQNNIINKFAEHYNEVYEGDLFAMINEAGMIEIAVKGGNASQLFNLKISDHIRIEFHDNKTRQTDHPSYSLS